jgi:malonyl-CoA/methylmalonyl-CoA synthetase
MATPGAPALVFGDDGLQNAHAIGRCDDLPGAITQQAGQAPEQRAALLLYTSGTTARPKGVALTHRNVFSGVEALINAWGMSRTDTLIHTLPLHHLHGICAALLSSLCAGGATHFIPRYDAPRVLDALAGASVLMGVPTQHKLLLDHIANCSPQQQAQHAQALRRLRLITSGSAKLPESIGRRLQALSGQYPLEHYGMTEVGIVLSNPLFGARRPGSCGSPLPGCDVRIVDEGGQDKAAGEAGEIWIRGDSVFAEYDADPDATDAAFDRGFFKSGDTARWTADGFVEILGRTSVDIIKSGGYKLSAIEIEEELRAHPWVNDVAVVGCADEKWGQRAIAVIVPSTDGPDPDGDAAAAASQALRVWLKERLAPYKVPRAILWRSALPRNALGKVQKTELKAEVALLQG